MLPSTIITDLGYYTRPIWDKNTNNFKLIPHYYAESVPLKTLCELHGWNEKKNKNIKIYDAVIFSVELDLLEIRIRELWDIVDTFVILESNATFTGETKKLTFSEHRQRFEFAKEKLHHVTINQHPLPAGEGPFYNENQMRRAMDSALIEAGVQEGDLIIMSDVDEIVRPQTLSILKACDGVPDVLHLQLKNYLYSFEFFLDSNSWRAHIVRYKGEQTSYTHGQISENLLSDAGWHCSFCFRTISEFQFKMKSYSHADRVRYPELLDSSRIQKTICDGNDIFDMPPEAYTYKDLISKLGPMQPSTSSIGLPSTVLNNAAKYRFLLPGGCVREDFSAMNDSV